MIENRLTQIVCSVLFMADFAVSERCTIRPRSFDLIAVRDDRGLVIRISPHIDGITEEVAHDLDRVSRYLRMVPLIVGERARDTPLRRGAVYLRYGIHAVSVATLHDYLVEHVPPLVYILPGGPYVNIDGSELRRLREGHQLSLGDLAHLLGVSRRAISKYESGMGTSLDVAIRLEDLFDTDMVVPIDLFSYTSQFPQEEAMESPAIQAELGRIGMKVHTVQRAPFEALVVFHEHRILTGYGTAERVVRRASLIGNISRIVRTHAMCIIKDCDKEKKIGNTLVLGEKRLNWVEDGFELIEMIQK
ncbi:MAG: transcriptional regulator [Methanomicrobiales archaeon]|nr:transcriptional regulator [Methanomicrobiales archaeon]